MLNLEELIKTSMKSKNSLGTKVYRAIKAEKILFEKNNPSKEYNDSEEIAVIKRMIKQRNNSIDEYIKANRLELAKDEQEERDFLNELLPQAPSDEIIKAYVDVIIDHMTSPVTGKDMGFIMKEVKKEYPAVDGKTLSIIVKDAINHG